MIPAVISHFAKLNWLVAAQRRQALVRNHKPPKLTLAAAVSTLAAAAAAAGAIWPAIATAQPAGPVRITSTSAKAATAVTAASAASQTSTQIAAKFEAATRLDAVRMEVAQARRAELLVARRLTARKAAARRQAAAAATSGTTGPSATAVPAQPAVAAAATGSPQQIAMAMLGSFGWSSGQFSCLDALWNRESGWNPYASNAGSGAYGIPQALPGSKMASAGADWQTNPATQIRWGLGYIQATYGSPCGAWGHEQGYGWY